MFMYLLVRGDAVLYICGRNTATGVLGGCFLLLLVLTFYNNMKISNY